MVYQGKFTDDDEDNLGTHIPYISFIIDSKDIHKFPEKWIDSLAEIDGYNFFKLKDEDGNWIDDKMVGYLLLT